MTGTGNAPAALKWHRRPAVQRRLRLLARLGTMRPAELSLRLSRALDRRTGRERLAAERLREHCLASGGALLRRLGDDPASALAGQLAQRFLFAPGAVPELAGVIASSLPAAAARTVAAADRLVADGVELLGQPMPLDPATIDWQADPRSGRRVWGDGRLDEATAIASREADAKYVWELNRHQFLPTLARAYWLSGETRYARHACALLDGWLRQNPYGAGINWCSHLEIGMRSISWLWTLGLLLDWPELDRDLLRRWLQSLGEHYRHLAENLSIYTDPTNHLIGEATALWMLATCVPALPQSGEQAARTRALLLGELRRQVLDDGVNVEQASSYHRFVLDFYLQFLLLSRRGGDAGVRPLPAAAGERIERMIGFAADLAGEHGVAPMIGDSDDARALPLLELLGWDFRDCLCCGALAFRRGDWKARAGGPAEAAVWLFGASAPADYAALPAPVRPAARVRIYPQGGYCFLRTRACGPETELLFDAGPLGLWPNAAHGHADALGIQLRVNGRWLLADPGTGTYFSDRALRDRLRASAAHNTVTVDGLDQADMFDDFKWINPTPVRFAPESLCPDAPVALVEAEHQGYMRLRRAVRHRRQVLSPGDGGFVVVDRLDGRGAHRIVRHFGFDPQAELDAGAPGVVTVTLAGAGALRLWFPDLAAGDELRSDRDGLWSSGYGRWQPAPRLRLISAAPLPLTRVTFIDCADAATPSAGGEAACEKLAGGALLYRRHNDADGGDRLLLINPAGVPVALGGRLRCSAALAYLELCDGAPRRALLDNGTLEGARLTARRCTNPRFTYYG